MYLSIAQGNHLIHKINGKVTIDLVDHQAKNWALEGLLAFQVHKEPGHGRADQGHRPEGTVRSPADQLREEPHPERRAAHRPAGSQKGRA